MIIETVRRQFNCDFVSGGEELNLLYQKVADRAVRNVLKKSFPLAFDGDELIPALVKKSFYESLPLFTYHEENGNISLLLITRFRANAFKFFFDMISGWIVPGHLIDVKQFYSVDFRIPSLDDYKYTLAHILLRPHNEWEKEQIEANLPMMATEVRLGVSSSYYARRILETKGLSADQKTARIQEDIAWILKRRPQEIDTDILSEMQHFLVLCPDDFKRDRDSRHLSKLISMKYLFRRNLKKAVKDKPKNRHLAVKLFSARVKNDGRQSACLGVVVGVNFLSDKEVFEERHLFRAIRNHIPDVQPIPGSYFSIRKAGEKVATYYLEVKKPGGETFNKSEILRLTADLQDELKERVERLVQPLFMPRNEEEIMRNILSLSHQIQYLKDIPQVFINFDEQTYSHLFFTIIHVEAKKEGDITVEEKFKQADTFLECIHDFTKNVGYLRKKYPKQATVFRIKLSKEIFLRDDHSIDLYKARQVLVQELERILGHLRDFNGGMIAKQNEVLCILKDLLGKEGVQNDLLLENFFYSLAPASMRSIFDPQLLKTLFLLLLDTFEEGYHPGKSYALSIKRDLNVVFVACISETPELKDKLNHTLKTINHAPSEIASVFLNYSGINLLGYLYQTDDPYKQEHFTQLISHQVKI